MKRKQDDLVKKMNETWREMDEKVHMDVPDAVEMMQQINSGEKRYREKLRKELHWFIVLACVLLSVYIVLAVHMLWVFYVMQLLAIVAVVAIVLVEKSKGRMT
ncbi:YxlC family protein [Terribacillus sp. 179-K 1B1 HS]|uniref:YxlC family protein n=1 Tax=Terribacillus sp. 179-K 1B1 HS TaxID=3142388 RepID=UPI0039A03136